MSSLSSLAFCCGALSSVRHTQAVCSIVVVRALLLVYNFLFFFNGRGQRHVGRLCDPALGVAVVLVWGWRGGHLTMKSHLQNLIRGSRFPPGTARERHKRLLYECCRNERFGLLRSANNRPDLLWKGAPLERLFTATPLLCKHARLRFHARTHASDNHRQRNAQPDYASISV